MAGAIAHHFNNQLFAIMGSLELVMEQASGRAWEHHLHIAMDSLGKVSAHAAGHQASPGAAETILIGCP